MEEIKKLVKEEFILIEQIKAQQAEIKAQQGTMINTLQELVRDHESRIRLLESNAVRQTELLVSLKDLSTNQRDTNTDLDSRIKKNERLAFMIIGIAIAVQFLANFHDLIKAITK